MNNLDTILPTSEEGLYPIRTVSEVSGVNAITLRAWERRYGLFKPKRTPKGHRLYSEKDILRIREVLALLEKGVSIARVAKALNSQEKVANFAELNISSHNPSDGLDVSEEQWAEYFQQLLEKISKYDTVQLEKLHHDVFSLYPVEIVSRNLIFPVLAKLQTRASQLHSLAGDYHFYQHFLKQRIGGLFLKTSIQNRGKKLLLMGVAQEQNDIELFLFAMPLLTHGFQVIILGSEMSLDALPMALSKSESEGLVILVDAPEALNQDTLETLTTVVSSVQTPVFIAGEYDDKTAADISDADLITLPENSADQVKIIDQKLAKVKS